MKKMSSGAKDRQQPGGMKKLAFFGCGYLAGIVADALVGGLLPEYELVGVLARTPESSARLAAKMTTHGHPCKACASLEELLALKPEYLVEAANPAAMKAMAVRTLENGTSIITLSIGALADDDFREEALMAARDNSSRIYIASGATGGFDVLRTATLMGGAQAGFYNEKGVRALRRSPFYTPEMETKRKEIFSGTAREAIATFPTGLNVSVAASLASVGVEKMHVTMASSPEFVGDVQRVEIRNEQVHAVVEVYSATPQIAGWSVVATLQNIVSPIVF